jgi:ribosomal protein S27AE
MVEVNSKCPKCGEGIMKLQTEHTQLPRTDLLGRARCTTMKMMLRVTKLNDEKFPYN